MISHEKTDVTDVLIFLYIFGSVALDPGDNLMRLIKVLFVIPCLVYIVKSQKLYFNTYVKWMLCFAAFAGLSFLWALSISNAAYRYQTIVLNFVCIYALLIYLKNRTSRMNLILKTMLFAPLFLELRVMMSYGLMAFANTRSVEGIMNSNHIGMRAGIAVALGAYYFLMEKEHRMIYMLTIAFNAGIVVLSGSRKAILFMLIPLLLYYIFRQQNALKLLRNGLFAVLLAGVAYYGIMNMPIVYDMVGYRIESMINGILGTGNADTSTSMRMRMIEYGLEWFKAKPWIGYGINNYMSLLGTMNTFYGARGIYAHNNYIEMMVDLGLIGTMIYYYIYLKMLGNAVRIRKQLVPLQLLMVSIFISIMINEYGMVTYIDVYTQIILMLTWTLLFRVGEKTKGEGDSLGSGRDRSKEEVRGLTC